MPTNLTDLAERRFAQAYAEDAQVAIAEIALGDGGGAAYEPGWDETALRGERKRLPIESKTLLENNTWRVVVRFPADGDVFTIYEIGFFSTAGELIALAAGADLLPHQVGTAESRVEYFLDLSRVAGGIVVVEAPDDAVFDQAVATAHAMANLQLQQLRQADQLARLMGDR